MTSLLDMPTPAFYIGGRWLQPADAERASVIDPATTEPISEVPITDVATCVSAVDAAGAALPGWAATPPRERSEILRHTWELMVEHRERLAGTIVAENGKALADARSEIDYAAEFFRWFSEEAVRIHGDLRRSPSGTNWLLVSREPAGVALLVTPWNYPAAMATRKLAPALAAGCTVVLKPAMETPLTALAVVELLEEAGVPPGVVNLVTPRPAGPAVAAMLADPRVRVLSFTGSTEVGRTLLATAAPNVVRCSMELGGNAPFLVLDNAYLDDAVEGLMLAKLRNGGSACTAANRVLLHEAIADPFTDRFVEKMGQVRWGDGRDPDVQLGALVNAPTRATVDELVRQAIRDGATLQLGGYVPDRRGYFYPPTVLTGVAADAAILHTEIFGPVAPIVQFDTIDKMISAANATEAGLIAYLYTRDLERGLHVSRRLRAGMVGLNRGVVSDPAAPFGGVKHSGLGREGAEEGIQEFLDIKYTATPYT